MATRPGAIGPNCAHCGTRLVLPHEGEAGTGVSVLQDGAFYGRYGSLFDLMRLPLSEDFPRTWPNDTRCCDTCVRGWLAGGAISVDADYRFVN